MRKVFCALLSIVCEYRIYIYSHSTLFISVLIRRAFKYLFFSSLFLLLFCNSSVKAQSIPDSLIILEGYILTNDSLQPVAKAHAISKFNRWGTISEPDGRFIMYASPHDSVLFTSVGFAPYILYITDSIVENSRQCQLLMVKDTIQINEIIIRAFYDYETFKQLVITMDPMDMSSFYPDWTGTELLYLSAAPTGFSGPVSALYNVFNRNAVLQRRLIKNRKKYNDIMIELGRPEDTIPTKPEHIQE